MELLYYYCRVWSLIILSYNVPDTVTSDKDILLVVGNSSQYSDIVTQYSDVVSADGSLLFTHPPRLH